MKPLAIVLVFLGAGAGGVCRYVLNLCLNPLLANFPLGTLASNVLGCGAAGGVAALLAYKTDLDPALRPLLIIGFLGGLTTFSSFALEVIQPLENGRPLLAAGIALTHVIASLAAAMAGLAGMRALLA